MTTPDTAAKDRRVDISFARGDALMRPAFWKTAILEALESQGGEAELQEIYELIENSDYCVDMEARHDSRPNYQHTVRRVISDLKENGELTEVSRGRYRIPGV